MLKTNQTNRAVLCVLDQGETSQRHRFEYLSSWEFVVFFLVYFMCTLDAVSSTVQLHHVPDVHAVLFRNISQLYGGMTIKPRLTWTRSACHKRPVCPEGNYNVFFLLPRLQYCGPYPITARPSSSAISTGKVHNLLLIHFLTLRFQTQFFLENPKPSTILFCSSSCVR